MKKNENPVIVEQYFNCSPKKIWEAITNADRMRKWFFDNIPEFRAEVGFQTEFNVKSNDRNFIHKWEIIEILTEKEIIYNWKYEGFEGDSVVKFQIYEENDGAKLTVTHIVLEDFSDNVPEFTRESCFNGWQYFIKQSLKNYLESEENEK